MYHYFSEQIRKEIKIPSNRSTTKLNKHNNCKRTRISIQNIDTECKVAKYFEM